MRLTDHFTLGEFTRSVTAQRLGIDNSLPDTLLIEASRTAHFMERIRDALCHSSARDVPINVESAYRCLALNRALKSDDNSDHPRMEAVDFIAPEFGTPLEICRFLVGLMDDLAIGQIIYEHTWVHVSRRPVTKAINRILTFSRHTNGYLPGIVERV